MAHEIGPEESMILLNLPGRDDGSIQIVRSPRGADDADYSMRYVRRLAWALVQLLPGHAVIALVRELVLSLQENALRGARLEGVRQGKALRMLLRDDPDRLMPGSIFVQFTSDSVPSPSTDNTALVNFSDSDGGGLNLLDSDDGLEEEEVLLGDSDYLTDEQDGEDGVS